MKVNFKMPRSLDGVDYKKGTHEVPDSLAKHWYLLAMIQNGVASIVEAPGAVKPQAPVIPETPPPQTPVVPSQPAAPSYHDHMANWESEEEKAKKAQATAPVETATQEEADKMIESGEATIPSEDVVSAPEVEMTEEQKLALKRSEAAKKAAATRAAKKAQANQ